MQLALHLGGFSLPGASAETGAQLAATARAAEAAGFSALTLMDHWIQMDSKGPVTDPVLEGYTGLAYVAALTRRIQLGLLVTGVTFRHPGLLAKTIATLDVLSGGRALLGLGAAWYEREHTALGVPFPPVGERFERLEETLEICRQMWSGDDGPFSGKHYLLAETICEPRPLQTPGPPVLVGGMGERRTLSLVARYADAANFFADDVTVVARKIEVLDEWCGRHGRDPAAVDRTIVGGPDPLTATDEFLRQMATYAALGVTRVWVVLPSAEPDPSGWVSRVGERVLDRLSAYGGPVARLASEGRAEPCG